MTYRKISRLGFVGLFAVLALFAASGAFSASLSIFPVVSAQDAGSVCAYGVPNGSVVDPSAGTVTFPNGTTLATTKLQCSMSVPWSTNAAYGYLSPQSGDSFTAFQSYWTVPSAPSSGSFSSPEGVGIWNGVVSGSSVLQPLLVYGCISSTDCSNSWRLTSYAYICGTFSCTTYYVTPAMSVSSGDGIYGALAYSSSITGGSGCSGTQPGWIITSDDYPTGGGVNTYSLSVCTSKTWSDAIVGSLEEHSLTSCTQLPAGGSDSWPASDIYWSETNGGTVAYEGTGSDISFCSASASWSSSGLGMTWT